MSATDAVGCVVEQARASDAARSFVVEGQTNTTLVVEDLSEGAWFRVLARDRCGNVSAAGGAVGVASAATPSVTVPLFVGAVGLVTWFCRLRT